MLVKRTFAVLLSLLMLSLGLACPTHVWAGGTPSCGESRAVSYIDSCLRLLTGTISVQTYPDHNCIDVGSNTCAEPIAPCDPSSQTCGPTCDDDQSC